VLSTSKVTPVLRQRAGDFKPSSATSIASSGRRLGTGQTATPITPTKSYQSFAASQRQPLIGNHTPNSTIRSGPSPKSSLSNMGTVICSKACKQHGDATPEKSPIRASPNRNPASSNRQEAPSSGPIRKISGREIRGQTLIRTAGKENPSKPSLDHRIISDKIEELYRAKSLERNHHALRRTPPSRDVATARARKVSQGDIRRRTEIWSELGGKKQSKVADVKKKFEGNAAPKAPIPVAPPSLPMPVFSHSSPFSKERTTASEIPVPPPPPLFLLPSTDTKRKSNISPETVQEVPAIDARKGRTTFNQPENPPQITTTQKQPSSNIRDRIKRFESIQGTKKPECETRKSSYTRRMRTSMKNLFEKTSGKSDEDGGGVGLSRKDVKDVIDEFQDSEVTHKFGKKNLLIGRWNTFPQVPPSSGTDGTMSEKGIVSPGAEGAKEMIIKEVECGLKQPKPVRVTEMKRMVLLCRERVGGIMDKERSRVAQSRRL
jgi:hypothetical protein